MIYGVYSMFDSVAGVHQAPFTAVNDEVAIRSFKANFANPGTVLALNPADFRLMKLGSFDLETGVITPFPVQVIFQGSAAVSGKE